MAFRSIQLPPLADRSQELPESLGFPSYEAAADQVGKDQGFQLDPAHLWYRLSQVKNPLCDGTNRAVLGKVCCAEISGSPVSREERFRQSEVNLFGLEIVLRAAHKEIEEYNLNRKDPWKMGEFGLLLPSKSEIITSYLPKGLGLRGLVLATYTFNGIAQR